MGSLRDVWGVRVLGAGNMVPPAAAGGAGHPQRHTVSTAAVRQVPDPGGDCGEELGALSFL